MRRTDLGFSVVDLLIIIALVLIVIGLFGPLVKKSNSRAKNPPARAAVLRPAR
jgi:competence protein ComGC